MTKNLKTNPKQNRKKTNAWKIKDKRFVLFLDILGFKDLVAKKSHVYIIKKLKILTKSLDYLSGKSVNILIKEFVKTVSANQTKAITFSDSIIVFSKGGTFQDATKIYVDAYAILRIALKNKIPMKGAISYGDITVDFDKPIFFGQPIIDAYLLHEDLLMLSTIIDHNAEKRFKYLNDKYFNESSLVRYNAFMKYGSVSHTLIRPTSSSVKDEIKLLTKLYLDTSGKSRIYIDNTLKFFNSLIKK